MHPLLHEAFSRGRIWWCGANRHVATPLVGVVVGVARIYGPCHTPTLPLVSSTTLMSSYQSHILTEAYTMTHVLLTGGNGALGRAIVKKLIETGHPVRIMSRRPQPTPPFLSPSTRTKLPAEAVTKGAGVPW